MAGSGDNDGPTINDELRSLGQIPDDEDDMGDAAHLLFGRSAPPTNRDDGADGGAPAASAAAGASAAAPSDAASLASSTTGTGKRRSPVWADFEEVKEVVDGEQVVSAICKLCRHRLSGKSANGTGHLKRHLISCKKKVDRANAVQSRLALNPDGSYRNWEYKPDVARHELIRLIARLDLPLSIADNDAWDDYIQRAHNPRYKRVTRFSTARDLSKLYNEKMLHLKAAVMPGVSSVCLTSDIWSGNAKEDYIAVVAHYITSDWELKKSVIGFKLIEVSHNGINIAECISGVLRDWGLLDKVFSVSLDNASSNTTAMLALTPLLDGYLGYDVDPSDHTKKVYHVVHQRCACHIINLIVKSGLKRLKPCIEIFRTAINFLNSSNQRIAQFKEYCQAKGMRPRKFCLDMDVRWNSTYLMLKHLMPYRTVFSVFINLQFGYPLLVEQHWYIAEKVLQFLELFYDSTVALSGVYYPTSPLVLHHILEIASHLHDYEHDSNLCNVVAPMKAKFLKYWKHVPLLYAFAFVLDPRAKMRGLQNVLDLLAQSNNMSYIDYLAEVKFELHKLYDKYESKFGAARPARTTHPSGLTGKRKQAWGKIFGGSVSSGPSSTAGSSAVPPGLSELTVYLDSDNVVAYDDDFDVLNWWHEHKLTFPVLCTMAKDIMSVPVSTTSSESCFSLTGRIIEERRRRLGPDTVEMLICVKDWELGEEKGQHTVEDEEYEDYFKNQFLDHDSGASGITT
ncbi:zinc finger BED domain-containing protein RICESLEEPER 2-like [Miscanthus floridulus]|uniref:zinc finger BED domain-containing protein RICESLEEPER 2-like n=1 Tax=Miscanthus floridulus TaxID=154761 RepID=UPI003458EC80